MGKEGIQGDRQERMYRFFPLHRLWQAGTGAGGEGEGRREKGGRGRGGRGGGQAAKGENEGKGQGGARKYGQPEPNKLPGGCAQKKKRGTEEKEEK